MSSPMYSRAFFSAIGVEEVQPRTGKLLSLAGRPPDRQAPLKLAMAVNDPESAEDSDSLAGDDGSYSGSEDESMEESL